MNNIYDKLFEHFSIQRNMYFNTCKFTNYGSYYFSTVIEDDCNWNYFIPLDYNNFINNINSIREIFNKFNRKFCTGISNKFEDYDKYITYFDNNNFNFEFSENWLIYNKKEDKKVNYKIVETEEDYNLFKYILLKTYTNPPSDIQPWGNISTKYLDAFEKRRTFQNNVKNIIFYSEDKKPISACSVCFEDEIWAIYNFAVLPKYQNSKEGYSAILGAIDIFNKENGKDLFIQVPIDTKFEKWLKLNGFDYLMTFKAYSKVDK